MCACSNGRLRAASVSCRRRSRHPASIPHPRQERRHRPPRLFRPHRALSRRRHPPRCFRRWELQRSCHPVECRQRQRPQPSATSLRRPRWVPQAPLAAGRAHVGAGSRSAPADLRSETRALWCSSSARGAQALPRFSSLLLSLHAQRRTRMAHACRQRAFLGAVEVARNAGSVLSTEHALCDQL